MQAERLRLPIADIAKVGDGTLMTPRFLRHPFSHPISHRTPRYRVEIGGIEWLVACQKRPIFQDETGLQATGQDGPQRFRKPLLYAAILFYRHHKSRSGSG